MKARPDTVLSPEETQELDALLRKADRTNEGGDSDSTLSPNEQVRFWYLNFVSKGGTRDAAEQYALLAERFFSESKTPDDEERYLDFLMRQGLQ